MHFVLIIYNCNHGNYSQNFDLMRLPEQTRERIAHYLRRRNRYHTNGVYRLFQPSAIAARTLRTDLSMKEYVGYTHNLQGQWHNTFYFSYLSSPLIGYSNDTLIADSIPSSNAAVALPPTPNTDCTPPELLTLRNCLSAINKLRPKFVVIGGNFTSTIVSNTILYQQRIDQFRKAMTRLSDTIPAVYVPGSFDVGIIPSSSNLLKYRTNFGADFYGFWYGGLRCLVLNSSLLIHSEECPEEAEEQNVWFSEEIEQAKLCSTLMVIYTYHPWFRSNIDEENEVTDHELLYYNSLHNSTTNGNTKELLMNAISHPPAISKDVRRKWLLQMRHHKVKLVITSALPPVFSTNNSTVHDTNIDVELNQDLTISRPFIVNRKPPADNEEDNEDEIDTMIGDDGEIKLPSEVLAETKDSNNNEIDDDSSHSSDHSKKSDECEDDWVNEEDNCEGPEMVQNCPVVRVTQEIPNGVRMLFASEYNIDQKYYTLETIPKSIQELLKD